MPGPLAALIPERRTPHLQQWRADQAPDDLWISNWVVTKLSSALSIKLRAGHLDESGRAEALALFTSLVEQSFSVLAISGEDFRTAARLPINPASDCAPATPCTWPWRRRRAPRSAPWIANSSRRRRESV